MPCSCRKTVDAGCVETPIPHAPHPRQRDVDGASNPRALPRPVHRADSRSLSGSENRGLRDHQREDREPLGEGGPAARTAGPACACSAPATARRHRPPHTAPARCAIHMKKAMPDPCRTAASTTGRRSTGSTCSPSRPSCTWDARMAASQPVVAARRRAAAQTRRAAFHGARSRRESAAPAAGNDDAGAPFRRRAPSLGGLPTPRMDDAVANPAPASPRRRYRM